MIIGPKSKGKIVDFSRLVANRNFSQKNRKKLKLKGTPLTVKVPVLMRNEPNLTVRTGQSAEIDFLIELEEHL